MKKRWLAASLAALMALSMTACGGGKAAETTAAPAETKAEETKAEESKAEEASKEETAEKAPEDYTGSVVVYSPHDAVSFATESRQSPQTRSQTYCGAAVQTHWQHLRSTSSRMYAQTMNLSAMHTKTRMACGSARARFRWLSSITKT